MTATVRVYKSTDISAPNITGTVGSLIAALDAILVSGYGSKSPAGWTKAFAGINLASYQMGAGTPRMFLAVDDTGTTSARVVGYETMSAVSTGTGPFPTNVQLASGGWMMKSNTADGVIRPWLAIACERAFWMWIQTVQTAYGYPASNTNCGLGFGAFPSYKAGDVYNCFINCAIASGSAVDRTGTMTASPASVYTCVTSQGFWIARNYLGVGGSLPATKLAPNLMGLNAVAGSVGGYYPDTITGGARLTRGMVCEPDGATQILERGYLPGFWIPLHNAGGGQAHFDTFNGSGPLAGKTFIFVPSSSATNVGKAILEDSGSWDL